MNIFNENGVDPYDQSSTLDIGGMVVTSIDNLSAVLTGMELVAGLIVKSVRFGSLAELAGIASGDIVCEIDGIPVTEILELKSVLSKHDPSSPAGILLRRVGGWCCSTLPLDEELFRTS